MREAIRTAAHGRQPDRVHEWFLKDGTAESFCGTWDVVEESLRTPRTPDFDTCRPCSVIGSALYSGHDHPDLSREDFLRLRELRDRAESDDTTPIFQRLRHE